MYNLRDVATYNVQDFKLAHNNFNNLIEEGMTEGDVRERNRKNGDGGSEGEKQ